MTPEQPQITFERLPDETFMIHLSGEWNIRAKFPSLEGFRKQIEEQAGIQQVIFDTGNLTEWDSTLLIFLKKVFDICKKNNISIKKEGLPDGVQRLLVLASAVPEKKGARKEQSKIPFLEWVANQAIHALRSTVDMLNFIGEAFIAFLRLLRGKSRFRLSDLFLTVQETGVQSLPIVSLISILVGIILAFIGAIQLRMFGAQIYVADIVGIAMLRVMGAVMTGVIMAGRTGAAFAAQLGTMQTNEEIDALKTLGISPMEFLVLPRVIALVLMMPLLCLYADFMGILGGMIVGVGMLDLNPTEYYNQTKAAVSLTTLWIGLFHSAVFAVIVALSGCLRGLQCGRSAQDVGDAATSAVVTGIVGIVVATALITFGCEVLGI
jgi:phospholipid/cholesterol/gamma-HCH transport system permease protein